MPLKNTTARYSSLTVGTHWFMLVLMIAVYATMEFKGIFPKGSEPRELMKIAHFSLGLSVLALVLIRIANRLSGRTPSINPLPPVWQQRSSHAVHGALYLLMISLPILGWLTLSAAGKSIPFFTWQLPPIMAENKDMASLIKEIHETVATAGYALIGAHAAAALYHHYVVRDNTLERMLPGGKSPIG